MKDVFIVNPHSGRNEQYRLVQEIKDHFQGKRIIIEKTKGPKHATFIAQKYALDPDPVHIFVCGGDGTLHEIINGIAGSDNITLSAIPIGTGNDFIKYFENYQREDFLDLSNYNDPSYIDCDLLKINGEYAINTISIGFDVYVAREANRLKQHFKFSGTLPYYLSMLYSLRKPIGHDYEIQIDDNRLPKDKYSFLVFANGRYYGGGYKTCPDALINDGIIDVCLIKDVKRTQILKLAKKYETGDHLQYTDLVTMDHAKTIHLDTNNQVVYANLDGEVREFKNPTIEIVENALHLAIPKKDVE